PRPAGPAGPAADARCGVLVCSSGAEPGGNGGDAHRCLVRRHRAPRRRGGQGHPTVVHGRRRLRQTAAERVGSRAVPLGPLVPTGRVIFSSGAMLSQASKQRLLGFAPRALIFDGLGTSESGSLATTVTSQGADAATAHFQLSP